MSDDVIAYALTQTSADAASGSSINMFTSSLRCRESLREQPYSTPVIVSAAFDEVSPINLAAALCSDEPRRDVYLLDEHPTGSLAARARAAGIRGIIDTTQATQLWGTQSVVRAQTITKPRPLVQTRPGIQMPPVASARPIAQAQPAPSHEASELLRKGTVVGIFSGRGGVGKSTVAVMLALLAYRRPMRVVLVDLDLQFGDISYLVGTEPQLKVCRIPLDGCLADAQGIDSSAQSQLQEQERMQSQGQDRAFLPPGAQQYLETQFVGRSAAQTWAQQPARQASLYVLEAPKQPEQAEALVPLIPAILDTAAQHADLVIVNTGAFWTGTHAVLAKRCNYLVFLMDQRASSLQACKQAVDLCVRLEVPSTRFLHALNGCGRSAVLHTQDVSLALGGVDVFALADGGALVDELLSLGCPLELAQSGNPFIASLEPLLSAFSAQETSASAPYTQGGETHLLGRILDFASSFGRVGGMRRVTT